MNKEYEKWKDLEWNKEFAKMIYLSRKKIFLKHSMESKNRGNKIDIRFIRPLVASPPFFTMIHLFHTYKSGKLGLPFLAIQIFSTIHQS